MAGNRLGKILAGKGYMKEADISRGIDLSKKEGIHFGEACIRLGLIDGVKLAEALAEQYDKEMIDLNGSEVDQETFNMIPSYFLHEVNVIPIKRNGGISLVTSDPNGLLIMDDIESQLHDRGVRIAEIAVAPSGEIGRLLRCGNNARNMLNKVQEDFNVEKLKVTNGDQEENLSIEKISLDSSPAVKLIDAAIYDALAKRATDIHIELGNNGLVIKYRLDGVLYDMMDRADPSLQSSMISRIKVMSELDISEKRIPQDGRFKISFNNKTIDFRVSIMPSIYGEDAVIRILDKEHITHELCDLSLDVLGFSGNDLKQLRAKIQEPYGMFLVTGPTGSGKTTTLYAAISEINTGREKIVTIEDPVEYELNGVLQIPVNEKKGLTFSRGLRSILRHDPDKIMVGEIRDPETAQIAVQSAMTGHLVFTTVHANNAFDVIGRFNHMGVDPYNFITAINCILAQRLIRLICRKCMRPVDIGPDLLRASGIDPEICRDITFYEGEGCDECHHTGYKGRRVIMELLNLSDEISDMIASKKAPSVIKKKAIEDGMVTLREAAIKSVFNGETTLEEINRVTVVEKLAK